MECESCAGTKLCGPCDGRGAFADTSTGDGFECEVCDGVGVCTECGGVGEIEEPDPDQFEDEVESEFDETEAGE